MSHHFTLFNYMLLLCMGLGIVEILKFLPQLLHLFFITEHCMRLSCVGSVIDEMLKRFVTLFMYSVFY